MGALAAIAGLVDFLSNRLIRALSPAAIRATNSRNSCIFKLTQCVIVSSRGQSLKSAAYAIVRKNYSDTITRAFDAV